MIKKSVLLILIIFGMSSLNLFGQKVAISGHVLDKSGQPIPGVTILVTGTSIYTTSGNDGSYKISCDTTSELEFRMVGYFKQNIKVGRNTTIDIQMDEEIQFLNEVVVIGYGTAKKSDLTGSVVSIKGDDLNSPALISAMTSLQGKVAGLRVNTEGGAPGTSSSISIRGIATLAASTSPLVIIDGLPGDGDNVNPYDVQSIEVLKDASACAIYGARGANGVIIITTRKGIDGEAKFSFDANIGWQNPWKRLDVLNSKQYATVLKASGLPLPPAFNQDSVDFYAALYDYNWQDEIFRTAMISNYHLGAEGGNEKTKYMISGTFFNQDGIIAPSKFTKYALRSNFDIAMSDKFNIILNVEASRSNTKSILGGAGPRYGGVLANAITYPPFLPIYNADGTYLRNPLRNDSDNPVAAANGRDIFNINNNIGIKFNLSYKILKDLTLRINNGVSYSNDYYNNFNSPTKTERGRNAKGTLDNGTNNYFNLINEDYLTYLKQVGKHTFTVLVAFTVEKNDHKGFGLGATGFTNDLIPNLDGASMVSSWNAGLDQSGMVSYLGRVIYDYYDKLLFTGSIRRDGSSQFGPDKKYGNFPSFSAAYKIINASNSKLINLLKLRGGWGVLGNSSIGNYLYVPMVGANTQYSYDGSTLLKGYSMNNFGVNDLHWEETRQVNLALDLGLINNRIVLTCDYYIKNTQDCLYNLSLPWTSGSISSITTNFAKIQNHGIEAQLHTVNLRYAKMNWSSDLSFSYNTNEVLYNGHQNVPDGGVFTLKEGLPRYAYWGYKTDGIFQNQLEVDNHPNQPGAAPGDIRFKNLGGPPDANGYPSAPDDKIDQNDKVYLGSPIPKFIYGLANTFTGYGFDLYVLIEGVSDLKIANINNMDLLSMRDSYNGLASTINYWKQEGQKTDIPRAIYSDPNGNSTLFSDRFTEDGSYLRFRTITLGYTLPSSVSKLLRIEKLRVYCNAQNALTFAKYSGFDPEVGIYDDGVYPAIRTISLGLNVVF